ncbi:MAG: YdcF family protein [Stygiobacter sp.]
MLLKKKYRNRISFIPIGILSLVFMCVLVYIKYESNGISFKNFKLNYIGNILNFIISIAILISSIILKFSKKDIQQSKKVIALILMVLSYIALVLIIFIDKFHIVKLTTHLFNVPIQKFLTGFLFSFAITLQVYLFNYIVGFFFEQDKLYGLRILIRTVLSLTILIVFTLFYVWNVSIYSVENLSKKQYDYGCIPGAAVWSKNKPSPIFEARIRKTLGLFRKKYFKKIILTGGNAPGEITEAETAERYLINLGVNKKDLIVEKTTSTTSEQIKYLKNNFADKEILIVSDGFHLSRIKQMAQFFNLKVEGVSSDYALSFEKTIYYRTRESIALLMFWLFAI